MVYSFCFLLKVLGRVCFFNESFVGLQLRQVQ